MNDIFFQDITSLSQKIKAKEVSPVELTSSLLERISTIDPAVNAFIKVLEEQAASEARLLEKELMEGTIRGPLHGLPIAVKDNLETKGIETTSGSKVFEKWRPEEDATVIQRLKAAGAIIIGKTNLHEFAMGATTENPHYGVSRNPWDLERIPGGSSGGSAVAVATGMCFGAIGTDTAGSIRLPAAICGITGMKPTYGRVSRQGCLPFSWSLDHIGPMTKTVKDSSIILNSIAGYDVKDPTSSRLPVDVMYESLSDLKGVTLAAVSEHFFEGIDHEVTKIVNAAINEMKALGAEVIELELEGLQEVLHSQKIIAQSEVASFHEPLLKNFKHLYGEDLQFRFQFGSTISATEYIHAQRIRNLFIQQLTAKMNELKIDAVIAPTNARPPYKIGTIPPEEAINNMFELGRTPFANITGFPSLTIPAGFLSNRLPAGIQLIGRPFEEKTLFQIGEAYEQSQEWVNKLAKNQAYLKKTSVQQE